MVGPYGSHEVVFDKTGGSLVEVTLSVSLYNYQDYIVEAFESVRDQTLRALDLIVVDDHSTDDSTVVAADWLRKNEARFNRIQLVRHDANTGLAAARNTAFELAGTEYVFVLDADNQLYPRCLSRCLAVIKESGAAFVYPTLEVFGARSGLLSKEYWNVDRLKIHNYIDAMSMVRLSAWRAAGGYSKMTVTAWEDYDFWCKMVELGLRGVRVPEILARYRAHKHSMLNTKKNPRKELIESEMQWRHPWLTLRDVSG